MASLTVLTIGPQLSEAYEVPPRTPVDVFVSMLLERGGFAVPDPRELGEDTERVVMRLAQELVVLAPHAPAWEGHDGPTKDAAGTIGHAAATVTSDLTAEQALRAIAGMHPELRQSPARRQAVATMARASLRRDLRRVAAGIVVHWSRARHADLDPFDRDLIGEFVWVERSDELLGGVTGP